jgi:amino acid adenylation domain-containing protein
MTLHRLIDRAAQRRPEAPAARCDGEGLSYGQLSRRANGLAGTLLELGLERGDRVAVWLRKSLEVPVAFYGTLASGGVLVPIDPRSPVEQAARIVRAAGARFLVTEPGRAAQVRDLLAADVSLMAVIGIPAGDGRAVPALSWDEVDQLATDDTPEVDTTDLDPAYILHTSGSTGDPKLILHTHRSALAFVDWAAAEYGLSADDRLSNHSSHHTCFATLDYYCAARVGACTVILTPATLMMPASLAAKIESEKISIWYSVPTALVHLSLRGGLEARDLGALRWVLFAGEPFPGKHLRRLRKQLPGARFSHVYGSTEVNVCTYHHLPAAADTVEPLPIGVPCATSAAAVVDHDLAPVAEGDVGELLIRGSTVMAGYWNDPEANRRALVKRSFVDLVDEVWFRTGDRVRRLPDGNLTFVARADFQVKIRGYRVELEEVEASLLQLDGVDEAAAVAIEDEDGESRLLAAVVLDDPERRSSGDLLRSLARVLPPQAVPSEIHALPAMPRTATGKIDRSDLATRWSSSGEPHAQ